MTKKGNFYVFVLYYFSRFYKTKTRPPPKKNVRHNSLDQDVGYVCRKCQESIYRIKRDIDVQEIKVENAFFLYTWLHHRSFSLYCIMIFISLYMDPN